jgi:hypothetical protein
MRNKHAITLEHLRIGALKGVILDADGSVIYDLFDEFEITPRRSPLKLPITPAVRRQKACLDVLRYVEDNLKGEFMNGVHCLCSPEFFDALTGHAKVEKAFENWQEGKRCINDMRAASPGGITFEEYRGRAVAPGTVRRFIAPVRHMPSAGHDGHLRHLLRAGRLQRDRQHGGQPLYAKQEPRKFDRGTDLHTQSNPLPMCHRPACWSS